ncbi:hypothetical protein [Pseudomonas sp. W4I3]|uniref:hypothetical protein n=1 Tax=Pseudomonas sp. W4I3 TaxID=3042294 RepID=UPI00358F968A
MIVIAEIARTKPGALLINTAHVPLVNDNAVSDGLAAASWAAPCWMYCTWSRRKPIARFA